MTNQESKPKMLKFILNGCDISFIAEAPEDMTLKQLLDQASRIKPDWCACGIRYLEDDEDDIPEIIFDYADVKKADEDVSCRIYDEAMGWVKQ